MDAITLLPQTVHTGAAWKAAAQRAALFALFLICSMLVFVLGVDYHTRFWTNSSGAFKVGVSAMEEIWFRGLFLKRLEPAIGAVGALLLTTLVFGTSHLFATYIDLWGTVTFGIITCTLGMAWGLLMQKTNTLWGSVAFHAAGDVFGALTIGF